VHQAIACGASTPKAIFAHAGCQAQCAKCVCEMRQMIDEAQVALKMAAE
jgi:bacterioferritin-associated ferredoxin